jgi:hypothetical protein
MPHHGNWFLDGYDAVHDPSLGQDEVSHLLDDITTPKERLCGRQLPAVPQIGHKGDQESGREECIMRYRYWADGYFEADGSLSCSSTAPSQTLFCDSPSGAAFTPEAGMPAPPPTAIASTGSR